MQQVQRACNLWSGKGGFVFTSSAAVYSSEDGGPCSEDSSLVALGNSERTDRYECRVSGMPFGFTEPWSGVGRQVPTVIHSLTDTEQGSLQSCDREQADRQKDRYRGTKQNL